MSHRLRSVFLAIGLLLVVVGGVLLGQTRRGDYRPERAASLPRTAPLHANPDGNYEVPAYPSFPAEMPDGEGKQEVESFCAVCHSTLYITMQPPLQPAEWEAEVRKMIKGLGAPIPEAAEKRIISYLQVHYTPENRKQ